MDENISDAVNEYLKSNADTVIKILMETSSVKHHEEALEKLWGEFKAEK